MPSRKTKTRKFEASSAGAQYRASRKIAELIREKRIEKNLSQGELAKALGYESPQYVSDWERAYSAVPLAKIAPLSKILGLDRDRLFEIFLAFAHERLERELRKQYREILVKKS